MFSRFLFNRMSLVNKVGYLKKKGVMLGTRLKDGRRMYIYMFSELFIEVLYKNDNQNNEPERLTILKGLDNLNQYLEKEFKGSNF